MSIEVDCRTLPCPQPVLKCKEIIEGQAPRQLVIIVDNDAARDNVSRFMNSKGYDAVPRRRGTDWAIEGTATNSAEGDDCPQCEVMSQEELDRAGRKTCVFIASESIGRGDDELGKKLMVNFLATLPELGSDLWRIVLVNGGVRLSAEGHPCLEKLRELEQAGCTILVCGTCLEHFRLMEQRRVGQTTNMLDVVTSMQLADKVLRP